MAPDRASGCPSLSTYSADIDFVFSLIFWIVGFWFLLTELVFFWLIVRFRKKRRRARPSTSPAS